MTLSRVSFVLKAVLGCVLTSIVAAALNSLFIRVNLVLAPQIPWFALPMVAVSWLTLTWTGRFAHPSATVRLPKVAWASLLSILAAVVLIVAGLLLMGYASWHQGQLLLPGDSDRAPAPFRNAHSLAWLACAGLTEEGPVRNIVQLRLQQEMTPLRAEVIAGVLFVLLHVTSWSTHAELPYVILLAVTNGRLTTLAQSARYPALTHALSNFGLGAVVLFFRQ